jgi:predicted ATP-dependent protease
VQTGHIKSDGRVWGVGGVPEKHQATLTNNRKFVMPKLNEDEVNDVENTVKVETLEEALSLIFAENDA